ncbi:V-type ATP synthase subunit A [Nocardioides halotolerans]|uniref:V-type ATP synthase subunit A n=1 Tax=Nocardioides halotolerans TaxID=433660 RepID=UPI0004048B23|nr:V-type ATP synthase subunit A [Nocardioides halotolerans]
MTGQVPSDTGGVVKVSGPVVTAAGLPRTRLFDVVRIGTDRILGEVIRIDDDLVVVQAFEDTTGLRVDEPVVATGEPLYAELGPGLLGAILDGTQRPLESLGAESGHYIARGADPPRLDPDRLWDFQAAAAVGNEVTPGDLLGTVTEGRAFEHRVLVPTGWSGTVTAVRPGPATVLDPVVDIDGHPVTMMHRWPLRRARPVAGRLPLTVPLNTGQRVLDLLFPVARGGSAIIPGGFGTGKTVMEQALAKFSSADVVVYVGCGERGNELTEVLEQFPRLTDPRNGASLMERTVMVANTSNMPVAAREASIYTGITVAEYFRDQGYDVAMLADSTSRWGEALREVSSRLEEMPAEDGYPAYLATRLAGFYERAGAVQCLGTPERNGSVTIVGAVSPAGGDFSEPITQHSLRLAGCFWALDTTLSRQRHFPAVNWLRSFSQYDLDGWYDCEVADDWSRLRRWAAATLQDEGSLQEVVSLLGVEAIAAEQRITLRLGQALREDLLQQSSFDPADATCPPDRLLAMLRVLHAADGAMSSALSRGVAVPDIVGASVLTELGQMRRWPAGRVDDSARDLTRRVAEEMELL